MGVCAREGPSGSGTSPGDADAPAAAKKHDGEGPRDGVATEASLPLQPAPACVAPQSVFPGC